MSDKNLKSEIERIRAMQVSAQMVGIGLSQLLMLAYERIDELEAEIETLKATAGPVAK